jgi:hypothetical protein
MCLKYFIPKINACRSTSVIIMRTSIYNIGSYGSVMGVTFEFSTRVICQMRHELGSIPVFQFNVMGFAQFYVLRPLGSAQCL